MSLNLFSTKLQVLKWHHNHSQSTEFGLAVLYPAGSEIWCFWFITTQGGKIAIEIFFLLFLSAHCGDFIKQIKKESVIYTLMRSCMNPLAITCTNLHYMCFCDIWKILHIALTFKGLCSFKRIFKHHSWYN